MGWSVMVELRDASIEFTLHALIDGAYEIQSCFQPPERSRAAEKVQCIFSNHSLKRCDFETRAAFHFESLFKRREEELLMLRLCQAPELRNQSKLVSLREH